MNQLLLNSQAKTTELHILNYKDENAITIVGQCQNC